MIKNDDVIFQKATTNVPKKPLKKLKKVKKDISYKHTSLQKATWSSKMNITFYKKQPEVTYGKCIEKEYKNLPLDFFRFRLSSESSEEDGLSPFESNEVDAEAMDLFRFLAGEILLDFFFIPVPGGNTAFFRNSGSWFPKPSVISPFVKVFKSFFWKWDEKT